MYAREIDGQVLTLGVDGRLWRDNLVMYDRETESRWAQLSGVARLGRLQGRRLRRLPAVLVPWAAWRSRHPDGTVLVPDPGP